MKKFAVNVIGYVEDNNDQYTSDQIERMLNTPAVTQCFQPMKTVAVIVKQLPDHVENIDVKKVKKRYKFTQ